jgi:putative hydrolase of the HAD superfamily
MPTSGSPAAQSAPGPSVDGVLLDIDDTLVDTRRAFFAAIHAVSADWLSHLPEAGRDDVARRWIADVGGHFRTYTRGEISIAEQRRRRVDDLQQTFGGDHLDNEQFDQWFATYDAAFRAAWRLHDDALELLDRLEQAGVRFGALSNSSRALSIDKLAQLGLAERLPLLVSPDDLGFGKPDPRVFALACQRLGAEPARTAYVGDELDVDAQGARAAGLVGIWLDRPVQPPARASGPITSTDGVLVAHGLGDLSSLLDLGGSSARR